MTTFGDDIYLKTINREPVQSVSTGSNLTLTGTLSVAGTATFTNAGTLVAAGQADFTNTVIKMTALPTNEPTVLGELWNDGGIVKIKS